MQSEISLCVQSIRDCKYPLEKFDVYVVADHCTDETTKLARDAGASIFERDTGPAGKTYTLAWTFDKFAKLGIDCDLYVVVDATARVDPGFIAALVDMWAQGEDIIVSHPVLDARNQKWFARCLGLTLAHRNLQNRARQRLGMSSFIEGRGMAYSRRYIKDFSWRLALPTSSNSGTHPTEDWRHAVRAVDNGLRVAFADDAKVFTPLRQTFSAATQQSIRWERGRMANAFTHAVSLLLRSVKERSRLKFLAAIDAIQPPVVILGALCLVIMTASLYMPLSTTSMNLGILPFLVFALYGVAVVFAGRKDGISPITIFWAPVYVAWRSGAFILSLGLSDKSKPSAKTEKKA
jgi:cellulose synthase/poly-beta-1,6-N-acetylglucosamine synthase-like glycosyltransferase